MNAAAETAITLPHRAQVALASTETELKLRELVKSSADIVAVIDPAGRDQAHRIGMTLKTARVSIEKTGKAAREDAVAFGKAVITEEKRLIEIVSAEEDRVFKLRDGFDAVLAAEKAAKEKAEAERVAALAAKVAAITILPVQHAHASSAKLYEVLSALAQREITVAEFVEQTGAARVAVEVAAQELQALYAAAKQREQIEADRLAELEAMKAQAEASRLESERLAAIAAEERARTEAAAAKAQADAQKISDLEAKLAAATAPAQEPAGVTVQAEIVTDGDSIGSIVTPTAKVLAASWPAKVPAYVADHVSDLRSAISGLIAAGMTADGVRALVESELVA